MSRLQLLQPGKKIDGDWCNFPVPSNMTVGDDTYIDSSSCFKKYFSKQPVGLKIGSHVTIEGADLAVEKEGIIEIGDYTVIIVASIVANKKITIGSHVYVGLGVTIVDTDFHPLESAERLRDTIAISTVGDRSKRPVFDSKPVVIEDDVWIGYNSTILKGVTVGRGSVIQPGTVVLKNIPEYSFASGNPATITPLKNAEPKINS